MVFYGLYIGGAPSSQVLLPNWMIGLILVPNGKLLGQHLGDRYPGEEAWQKLKSAGGGLTTPLPGLKNVTTPTVKIRPANDEEGPGKCFFLFSTSFGPKSFGREAFVQWKIVRQTFGLWTSDQWAFSQWTFVHQTFWYLTDKQIARKTFGSWIFSQWIFGQWIIGQWTFGQWTLS